MLEELGISGGTAIIVLAVLYFIIKWAVKNGVKEAYEKMLKKEQRCKQEVLVKLNHRRWCYPCSGVIYKTSGTVTAFRNRGFPFPGNFADSHAPLHDPAIHKPFVFGMFAQGRNSSMHIHFPMKCERRLCRLY